ncbi:MAG: hypothetical protein V1804_04705 [Patescibacteria group bacterium]
MRKNVIINKEITDIRVIRVIRQLADSDNSSRYWVKIKKVKLTFLIFAILVITSFAVFAMAQENSTADKNIFQDSDQDGLSNDEEKTYGTDPYNPDTDGDGYSDGIEVKSGYNPLKPAPGDKIVNQDSLLISSKQEKVAGTSAEKESAVNLTEELSAKVNSLITQSEKDSKNISIEDLDSIINETTSNQLTFDDLPKIDESTIKIKEQTYSKLSEDERKKREKEDATEYLTAMGYVAATNSPQSIQTQDDIQKLYNDLLDNMTAFSSDTSSIPAYFTDLSDKGKLMLEQMKDIEVPRSMIDYHIKGLQLANYAISIGEKTKEQKDDPIAMIISVSKLDSLLYMAQSLFSEISNKLNSLGISTIGN